jgi:hypothetical protein
MNHLYRFALSIALFGFLPVNSAGAAAFEEAGSCFWIFDGCFDADGTFLGEMDHLSCTRLCSIAVTPSDNLTLLNSGQTLFNLAFTGAGTEDIPTYGGAIVLDPASLAPFDFSITIHESISEVSFTGSGLSETGRTEGDDGASVTISYTLQPEGTGFQHFVYTVTSETGEQLRFRVSIAILPPGDANGDHCSDMSDYVILDNFFGTAVAFGPLQGDFNLDGKVSIYDFPIFLNGFNNNNCEDQAV